MLSPTATISFREEIQRELGTERGGSGIQSVEPKELISMLHELDKLSSRDAVVRQRIAELPNKVTDPGEIKKLQSKQDALALFKTVNEATLLLDAYNSRLQLEMTTRRKTALHLAAFIRQQQVEMENDKRLIDEWQKKLKQVGYNLLKWINSINIAQTINFVIVQKKRKKIF